MNLRNHPLFTILFILLVLLGLGRAYPSFTHVETVWEDMINGRPFDELLFFIEWALIFMVFFRIALRFLPQNTELVEDSLKDGLTKTQAATKDEADFFNKILKMEEGPDILKSGAWRTELMDAIFTGQSKEIESAASGTDLIQDKTDDSTLIQNQSLESSQKIDKELLQEPFTEVAPVQYSPKLNLLVMDLDEAAQSEYLEKVVENGLSRRIEDLLHEQDALIYGEGIDSRSNAIEHSETLANERENEANGSSSFMRVVYRSSPVGDQIPEFLRKVFAARSDPAFFKQLEDLLSV